ncbi:MAG: fatty acid desaturase [Candidatus Obscuribacterales bacterium]|nr:fatty acid desaturase [Candidatus Obscuribacterales bacterium]
MNTFFAVFVVSYLFHMLGATLGYHRLLSHRSLVVPKWLEYFIVSGGYLALEGSPIFWITTHRLHHRYSDKSGDPHSPLDGFWHAFIRWMSSPAVDISAKDSQQLAPDLYRDPVYRFLHCGHTHWDGYLCLFFSVLFRVAIYFWLGPLALVANLLATGLAFLGPLLVNTITHMPQFGYRTYDSQDNSRNVWFVALLSMGEGWHNNHHAFPQSARHGLKPLEVDGTWIAILILKSLGLARNIRLPRVDSEIADDAKLVGPATPAVVAAEEREKIEVV